MPISGVVIVFSSMTDLKMGGNKITFGVKTRVGEIRFRINTEEAINRLDMRKNTDVRKTSISRK